MAEEWYETRNWRGERVVRSRNTWEYSGSKLEQLVSIVVGVPLLIALAVGVLANNPAIASILLLLLAAGFVYRRAVRYPFGIFDFVCLLALATVIGMSVRLGS